MTAPTLDLAALRAAAEWATPGPWIEEVAFTPPYGHLGLTRGANVTGDLGNPVSSTRVAHVDPWGGTNDATYIAAASPDVMLALLDRLEAAEAAVARVEAGLQRPANIWWHPACGSCIPAPVVRDALRGDL